jgi:hypothetical protein
VKNNNNTFISFDEEKLPTQSFSRTENHRFQMKVYETLEMLQDSCPYAQTESTIRRVLAQFGEAYLFFNPAGDLCFVTDFVTSVKEAKS